MSSQRHIGANRVPGTFRWLLAVVLGGVSLSLACGSGASSQTGGSCTDALQYQHRVYVRVADQGGFQRGRAAGRAVFCSEDQPPVRVYLVKGINRKVALISRGGLYAAKGFMMELKVHPLHRLVAGKSDIRRCRTKVIEVRGRVVADAKPQHGFDLDIRGKLQDVVPTATAVVRTRKRAGVPQVLRGQRLRVTGRRCVDIQGTRVIVARLIRMQPKSP